MTDPQLIAAGKAIVSLLGLKPTIATRNDDEKNIKFQTSWGTATYIGLALRTMRVIEEAKQNY